MLPPTPVALVTDQQYQSAFGQLPTPDQQSRMAAAGAAVRRAAGWHIGPVQTQTFTLDGNGGNCIQVPTLRLVDVLAVTNAGDVVDLDVLDWSHDGWIELQNSSAGAHFGFGHQRGFFTSRPRQILITITHGFEDYPDLVRLVADAAGRATPAGITQESNGSRSVTYAEPGLYQAELAQVALYRLPRL